jgi:hypothetical protein
MTSITQEPAIQSSRAAHLAFGAPGDSGLVRYGAESRPDGAGYLAESAEAPTLLEFNDPGIVWTQPSEVGLPPTAKRGTRARSSTAKRERSQRKT